MTNGKILLVDDEKDIVTLLKYNLEKEGYKTISAYDGETGLEILRREKPDLVILDLMLPKLSGFEFCKIARRESKVPILMLTAKKQEVDKILGLELGADDYVTKPFSVREVVSRIKAILRRVLESGEPRHIQKIGGLSVDFDTYETKIKGKPVALSSKEFEFLKCLIQARGKALSRDALLEKVWGYDSSADIDTRTIDQHIARLRDRLGSESNRIITVKNVGYRIKLD